GENFEYVRVNFIITPPSPCSVSRHNIVFQELESKLYRPHLLSIKPQEHPLLKCSIPPPYNTTTISSLPPPLPFPPSHTLPSMENDACDVGSENVGNPSTGDDVNSRIQALPQSDSRDDVLSSACSGYLESVNPVLADISEVHYLESVVAHVELGYSGTCDCIATYRDSLCLIDWKTSSKPRPLITDLHDYPLQAVAYAGAVNQDLHYPFKVDNVAIVVAYPSGEPCHVHLFPPELCERYWDQWLLRLLHYQTLFSSDLSNVCF
ncbi:Mitochondrial genome maintenance exonuclease 1, partial [Geodia barretti]